MTADSGDDAMKGVRDPRIDPWPGDEIQQRSGLRIIVTEVCGDQVSWNERTEVGRYAGSNSWTLKGWREMVAKESKVVDVAIENACRASTEKEGAKARGEGS